MDSKKIPFIKEEEQASPPASRLQEDQQLPWARVSSAYIELETRKQRVVDLKTKILHYLYLRRDVIKTYWAARAKLKEMKNLEKLIERELGMDETIETMQEEPSVDFGVAGPSATLDEFPLEQKEQVLEVAEKWLIENDKEGTLLAELQTQKMHLVRKLTRRAQLIINSFSRSSDEETMQMDSDSDA